MNTLSVFNTYVLTAGALAMTTDIPAWTLRRGYPGPTGRPKGRKMGDDPRFKIRKKKR